MSSALNIGLSTGNVGIGNRSYNNQLIPASNGRINGVNITALNERTRTSKASAEACVSSWVTRASAAENQWISVIWAPELSIFVAVANTGTGNRVITSPDAITWTTRTSATDNEWVSVTWAPELSLLVAVAETGTGNRVMSSPNGITWTSRTSTANIAWKSVTWASELSIFVAVAANGIGNRVMTSPDGINWTSRISADNSWWFVTWSPELSIFVAVAASGTANRVMTSPNGTTWTTRTSAADNNWRSVIWAPELSIFVAVANTGTGNRVMTSADGITWITRASAADNEWFSVSWAPELSIFVAVAVSGTGNRIMTSSDGITWTTRTSAADNNWIGLCWASELSIFGAVAYTGAGNRVMTSAIGMPNSKSVVKALPSQVSVDALGNLKVSTNLLNNAGRPILQQTGGVLQVVNINTTASMNATGTFLNLSITPSTSSSKILVSATVTADKGGGNTGSYVHVSLLRNGVKLVSAFGNALTYGMAVSTRGTGCTSILDNPSTSSSITYSLYDEHFDAGGVIFYYTCSITAMEIAG